MTTANAIADAASRACQPTESALLGGTERPTFRRADLRLRWLATRLHTFVFVIDLPEIATVDVPALAEASRSWAHDHKGGLPGGLQTGSAAMPVFVVPEVGGLRDWAQAPQPLRWAAPLFPVVVSTTSPDVAYRTKPQRTGMIYESFFRDLANQLVTPASPA